MNPITIGGVAPKNTRSSNEAVELVKEIHGREDDFVEGDIEDRIYDHGPYSLKKIKLSDVDLDEFEIDTTYVDKIQKFIDKNKIYIPAIVYWSSDRVAIIDGSHRLNAINNLGIKTVLAYVGKR